jgi:hypothetical protein
MDGFIRMANLARKGWFRAKTKLLAAEMEASAIGPASDQNGVLSFVGEEKAGPARPVGHS